MLSSCRNIIGLLLTLLCTPAFTQQDPFFMPFVGDVFELSYDEVGDSKFRFKKEILGYEKIAKISWKEVKVKKSTTENPFPDIEGYSAFGMVLESEVIIKQDGCYEFALISDDGSLFWIDDIEIIDNDGMHKMRLRKDSLQLKTGKYPIKLWYYQGLPNQYGFIFDGRYISETCPSGKDLDSFKNPDTRKNKITLNCKHLFDYDSYILKEEVLASLDSTIVKLKEAKIKSITINGYTCNKGPQAYNNKLSQERANQLQEYFLNNLKMPGVIFKAIGHGSNNPIASNETEKTRQLNRRVEIIIE